MRYKVLHFRPLPNNFMLTEYSEFGDYELAYYIKYVTDVGYQIRFEKGEAENQIFAIVDNYRFRQR